MRFHEREIDIPENNSLISRRTARKLTPLFEFLSAGYLLLWVAIINGYPAVFFDTAGYLRGSIDLAPEPFRPIVYGLFIRLVSFGITPWLAVVAQSAIVVLLLSLVFDYLALHSAPSQRKMDMFLGLVVVLAFTTSLPWFIALIMPDLFTGVLFLSLFLLLYDPKLSRGNSLFLSCVLAISAGSHLSHLPILGLLILALVMMYPFSATRKWRPCRAMKEVIALIIVPISLSVTVMALANWRAGMGFTISPAGHAFLMGRLLSSGLAQDYLRQDCATKQLTPCKYLDNLPSGSHDFLWRGHPLLKAMGGWLGSRKEANEISFETIKRHPIRFLADSGRQMFGQFISFTPRDTATRNASEFSMNVDTIRNLFPADFPKYERSQQSLGALEKLAIKLSPFQKIVFWCASLVCLGMATLKQNRTGAANQLFVFALIFMFSNALVTGALAGVADRYQARVSWLMVLCCMAYFMPILLSTRGSRNT